MSTTPLTTTERARIYDALTPEQLNQLEYQYHDWMQKGKDGLRGFYTLNPADYDASRLAMIDAKLREFDALNKTPDLSRKMPENGAHFQYFSDMRVVRSNFNRSYEVHQTAYGIGNYFQLGEIAHLNATRRWAELARDSAGMFEQISMHYRYYLDQSGEASQDYTDSKTLPIGTVYFPSRPAIEASLAQFIADGFTVDMLRRPA